MGVAEAQRAMATIALAANTGDQRRPRAANQNQPTHQQQPQQPQQFTTNQPFIIYQTDQNPDEPIRDDG